MSRSSSNPAGNTVGPDPVIIDRIVAALFWATMLPVLWYLEDIINII